MRRNMIVGTLAAACWTVSCAEDTATPKPQDDFYAATNAQWLADTAIPPDVPWISPFVVNTLSAQDQVRAVVEAAASEAGPPGTPRRVIGDFYASLIDLDAVEAAGLAPLADTLMMIERATEPQALAEAFGHLASAHRDPDPNALSPHTAPLALSVWTDRLDARATALVLRPSGLGLPDRAYYLEEEHAGTLAAYEDHVAGTLALSGERDAHAAARSVLSVEKALAAARLPQSALHDAAATWHPTTQAALGERFPGLDWPSLLRAAGVPPGRDVVLTEPDYMAALAALVAERPAADWQAYLRWHILRRYAPHLPAAYRTADFGFYGRELMGTEAQRPRAELASLAVEGAFPNLVGRLWAEEHVAPETKRDVRRLAETVRDAFAARIAASDRLAGPTKAAALDKLAALRIDVAYPDVWPAPPDAAMRADDLIGNLRRLSEAAHAADLARLDAPPDRARWYDAPYVTSAYYVRGTNALAVPAGTLVPPYYDPDASLAENLGGIGTVIAHEMGHAFDDQGSRFDAEGALRSWWTPEDEAAFRKEIGKLVRQYGAYEALPGLRLDGTLTVSEAFADLTGLTVGYDALMADMPNAAEGERRAAARDYYQSFCRHWRAKYREPLLRRIVASDGHAPQRFRCNGPLSAFEPFYDAYGVGRGDGMYLPPGERALV